MGAGLGVGRPPQTSFIPKGNIGKQQPGCTTRCNDPKPACFLQEIKCVLFLTSQENQAALEEHRQHSKAT